MARKRHNSPEGKTSRHRIRDGLRELILGGTYPPGAKLPQIQLARHFGVSQSVIRESLLELKSCGLVEAVDNLGVFVSNLDASRVIEAYQIREVLEGMAARLCCRRAARADIEELKTMARRMYDLAVKGEKDSMAGLDREFHHRLIRISRNEMLEQLTESYRVLGKILRVDRNAKTVRDEHLAILRAIEADRPDEAERRMREHIKAAEKVIAKQVARGTFVPKWVKETTDPGRRRGAGRRKPGDAT